jgi:hypothetical protein
MAMTKDEAITSLQDRMRVQADRISLLESQRASAFYQLQQAQARVKAVGTLVDAQAEDEGLWFVAATAPEVYLQQELRRLHVAVEAALAEGDAHCCPECALKAKVIAPVGEGDADADAN